MNGSWMPDARVAATLAKLHNASKNEIFRLGFVEMPKAAISALLRRGRRQTPEEVARAWSHLFLTNPPYKGRLWYAMARAIKARRVVEFGTSFGLSTIYLASAVRDNGGGKVISTELIPQKIAAARKSIEEAGLSDIVEIREGNAFETLKDVEPGVDLVMLDGGDMFYRDMIQLLAPKMRTGALALAAYLEPGGEKNPHLYSAYMRDPANGFFSVGLPPLNTEVSVRLA